MPIYHARMRMARGTGREIYKEMGLTNQAIVEHKKQFFRASAKRKKKFFAFFEIDLSNRFDLAQIDLNPVFPSKIIDFRLKSIPIDGASVNARLTDIIAEYET